MALVVNVKKGRHNNLIIDLVPKVEIITNGKDINIKKENRFICIIYAYINGIMIGKDITYSKFNLENVNHMSLNESDLECVRATDCSPSGTKIIEGEFIFTMDMFKLIERERKNCRNVNVNAFVKLLYIEKDGQLHMIYNGSPVKSTDYIISSGEWICMMNSMGYKTIKTAFELERIILYKRFKKFWENTKNIFSVFNSHIKEYGAGYKGIISIIIILIIVYLIYTKEINIPDIIRMIINATVT